MQFVFWREVQKQLDSARFELENSESKVAAAEEKLRESENSTTCARKMRSGSSISSTSEALRLELEESRSELESARANFEAELNSVRKEALNPISMN